MNMDYCRFQNTAQDLEDCAEHMDDTDLSKDEERAKKKLIRICREIVASLEDDEDE